MSKNQDEMGQKLLTDADVYQPQQESSSSSSSTNAIRKDKQPAQMSHPTAPPYGAPILGEDYHSIFVDTLSTTKGIVTERGQIQIVQDDEAITRNNVLRNMRFKPNLIYRERMAQEIEHNANPNREYDLRNGARFLRPLNGFPITFQQNDFRSPNIKVVNHGFFRRILRGIGILFTLPFLFRPIFKSRLIEEGQFGFAKDADGNIEIYNSGKGYQTGLSPWTNIEVKPIDSNYVNMFNRVHMIKVNQGEYAVGDLNGHPVILPPGRHLIESSQFTLKTEVVNRIEVPVYYKHTDYVIKHGNTHIIRVPEGRVARAKLNGRIVLLEPEHGEYVVHDQNFELLPNPDNGVRNLENRVQPNYFHEIHKETPGQTHLVDLDPARVVTVPEKTCVIVRKNGKDIFLQHGRYALPDATYTYNPNAKYNLTDRLEAISTLNDEAVMSRDSVSLKIDASIIFTVVDVEKCHHECGLEDFVNNTKKRAHGMLYELIKQGTFLRDKPSVQLKGESSSSSSSSTALVEYNQEAAKYRIREQLADQVHQELSKDLLLRGIRLDKVLINSIQISDPTIRADVESEAKSVAAANADLLKKQIEAESKIIDAETTKRKELISADQKAQTKLIEAKANAEADAKGVEMKANADANALKVTTDAQSSKITILAEANAKAMVLEAQARQKAGELDAQTFSKYDNFGQQMLLSRQVGTNMSNVFKDANINMVTPGAQEAVSAMLLPSVGSFVNKMTRVVEHATPNLGGEVLPRMQNNQ